MASFATFVNRFVGVAELADAPPAVWTRTESPRLRPIANEDVYLFVKRIDNSTVARAIDPAARRARSNSVLVGFAAAVLVIAGLVPVAYNTLAGFTLQNLHQDQEKLKQERIALEASQATLLSYERLEKLAASLGMIDPVPQQVQFLDGKAKSAEARNVLPPAPLTSR
jgi:cell division protein FtsL